jgi:hypothetical protein
MVAMVQRNWVVSLMVTTLLLFVLVGIVTT